MELITLENGVRVALNYLDFAKSAAVSVYVKSGNVNEDRSTMGMSHFIEHMVFRGTESLTQREIYEKSDLMGGGLNAFTTKEYTCFYSRVLDYHAPEILGIICDMITMPSLKTDDISSEQGVVIEEIGMYEDSPEDLCVDLQNETAWEGSPLSYNILGTRESVKSFTAESVKSFMKQFYTADRIVVSVSGKFNSDLILKTVCDKLSHLGVSINEGEKCNFDFHGGIRLCKKDVEQTHISYAFRGLPLNDARRYAAAMFSSILGANSSSPLNLRIREEMGIAYSVYSFHTAYVSAGIFGIGGAVNSVNQGSFIKESLEILNSIRNNIDNDVLLRCKEQAKAAFVMSSDSIDGLAASVGRQLVLTGDYLTAERIVSLIDKVTLEDVYNAAKIITDPGNIAVSVVGNTENHEFYGELFENFKTLK